MIKDDVLAALSGSRPEFVPTQEGKPALEIDGQMIHSRYAPLREAERLVEKILPLDKQDTFVIVFGTGIGYHIDLIEKAGFRSVMVVERSPELFSIFSEVYDASGLNYVVSPEDGIEKIDSVFAQADIRNYKSVKTVILRGAYSQEAYGEVEERIERLMKVKLGDFATRLKFEELWFTNIVKNVSHLEGAYTVSALLAKPGSCPVAIISAGPSLAVSLDAIRAVRPYAVLVAVDTALMPLYEAGIVPDFVYSLDSQIHNLVDFSMMPESYLSQIHLVYDIVVHPELTRSFPGGKFVASTAHVDFDYRGSPIVIKSELVSWIESSAGIRFGDVETGGSVATSAFHFAYMLGATQIVLFGQDLAYTRLISHAPSTPHYRRLLNTSDRLRTIQSSFMKIIQLRNVFQIEGVKGKVYTDFVLNNFKGWFEESAASVAGVERSGSRIGLLNALSEGANMKSFVPVTADKLLEILSQGRTIDREDYFAGLKPIDRKRYEKIVVALRAMRGFLNGLKCDETIFAKIADSDFRHLERYFMKEKVVYDRYGRIDGTILERKIMRLKKNIDGVLHAG